MHSSPWKRDSAQGSYFLGQVVSALMSLDTPYAHFWLSFLSA